MSTLKYVPVTIQAGKSVSNGADCRGSTRITRIICPPDWTAAPITFCMSPDDGVYHDLYHVNYPQLDNFEITVPRLIPNSVVTLPPTMGEDVPWLKIRSGGHQAMVNQAADRDFVIVLEMPDALPAGPTGSAGPAGPTGATGPLPVVQAATGPTGGYLQSGNIMTQWGNFTSSTSGVTVNFPKPFIDGPPSVTASAASGGVLQVSATKTSITISCNSGTPVVSWKAIGS
jgi:hypothetical protein